MDDKASTYYNTKNKDLNVNKEVETYSMWSFIISISPFIIGFVPFINLFILFAPIVSIIFGVISLNKFDPKIHTGKGFGIAGIVIGSIFLLVELLIIAFFSSIIFNMLSVM